MDAAAAAAGRRGGPAAARGHSVGRRVARLPNFERAEPNSLATLLPTHKILLLLLPLLLQRADWQNSETKAARATRKQGSSSPGYTETGEHPHLVRLE